MTLETELEQPTPAAEPDWGIGRRRKRQLDEDEELEALESRDTVDFVDDTGSLLPRRNRKQLRQVSGVFREEKSLHNIGRNVMVMELVFSRCLSTKDTMLAGAIQSSWYTTACHVFRKRMGQSSFLRLWNSNNSTKYLFMEWELHYHSELFSGNEEDDDPMDEGQAKTLAKNKKQPPVIPQIQAVISLGSRAAYGQFMHEDAKLPFRQGYIYAICQETILTAPDFSFTATTDSQFGMDMVVQSLFIPKSKSFTLKAFGLEASQESWNPNDIQNRLQLNKEDLGEEQVLKAVLLIKYNEYESLTEFMKNFKTTYDSVNILSGFAEEIGCNSLAAKDAPSAVGFSFYGGPQATVNIYAINFLREDAENILLEMKNQVDSAPNGFCFMFTHDSRPSIKAPDSDDVWADDIHPTKETPNILARIRNLMPRLQLIGVDSIFPVQIRPELSKTNLTGPSSTDMHLTYGFLLLTY